MIENITDSEEQEQIYSKAIVGEYGDYIGEMKSEYFKHRFLIYEEIIFEIFEEYEVNISYDFHINPYTELRKIEMSNRTWKERVQDIQQSFPVEIEWVNISSEYNSEVLLLEL